MRDVDIFFFGYGSLIAEPECDESIVTRSMGQIDGYRRVFNKRSPRRGCERSAATLVFPDCEYMSFVHDDWVDSLAVGTCLDSSASLIGALVGYKTSTPETLLSVVDAREGYDERNERADLGYVREQVMVQPLDGSTPIAAWTYFSNAGGAYDVPLPLTAEEQARILINATPRPGSTVQPPHARGIQYLADLRRALGRAGCVDTGLEAVHQAAIRHDGHWCELLTAEV